MKVTIKDVAKIAGVSPATVSRVVGNYGYVSEKNRRRIQAAVQELGYRPNTIARSMVTKSTHTIGFVVTDITNPFFAQLARGVEAVTWQNGYTLILANTDEDLDHERAIISAFQEKWVDAFIVVPASSKKTPHLEEIVHNGIPLVLLDRSVEDLPVDKVMVDNENGAFQAVSHLVRLGHRRIGIIMDNLDITTNTERLNGYLRALRELHIKVDDKLIRSCQFTRQSAYQIITKMSQNSDRPTALFTANNFMTLGAIKAIHDAGLEIPRDIALVGFDDLDWSTLGTTQLTAVSQPVSEMGNIAGQRIIARLKGEKTPPMEIRLKTTFIIRDSSGSPLAAHPHLTP
jgi:LacI family transcriptional regulator